MGTTICESWCHFSALGGRNEVKTMEETTEAPKSGGMNMMFVLGVVVVVVLVGGGYYFFTQSNTQMTPKNEEPSKQQITAPTAAMEKGSVSEFTVKGTNFAFAPNVMKVKKGDTVKITFTNAGGFHDFTLDEFNVKTKQLKDGESETVEFVADKAGTFEYYCSVGQHRQMGMKGTLTVE
mgnify:CR=1 FL=1